MGKCTCRRCFCGTLVYIFVLLLLLFVAVFVVVPFIFKYSVNIQRNIIFPTWYADEANFSDTTRYLNGVRNIYVPVNEEKNISLGCWQILPEELLDYSDNLTLDQYDFDDVFRNSSYNILIYLHGNGASRSMPLNLYKILRKFFHVIACDYRGYGDSSPGELTENTIVNDTVNLYNWIREQTAARIFFWGHSLGTGVSTHTISNLKRDNFTLPSGLVLETPFSSVIDVMEKHPIVQLFSWMPWFQFTILTPMIENGFGFNSTKYVVDVDCPIMIIHAKDDTIIPYEFATKMYDAAISGRQIPPQGNVTYYLFDADRHYDHMYLYLAPELPTYISNFVDDCVDFESEH